MSGREIIIPPGGGTVDAVAPLRPDVSGARTDDELIDLWLASHPSDRTRKTYELTVSKLRLWARKDLRSITVADVVGFAQAIEHQAAASRRLTLSACSSLYEYGMRTNYLPANPVRLARIKIKTAPSTRRLEPAEVQAIIRNADPRHRLMIRTLYETAARISEFRGLRWRDVLEREGKTWIEIEGKGGKRRTVLLDPEFGRELLAARGSAEADAVCFPGHDGDTAISESSVRFALLDAVRRAGIAKDVSPHWLRAAHASHALENGAPLHVVRDTLGHANIAVTNTYLRAAPTESSALYLRPR